MLQLIGLVGILEDKSVEESVAADLELGLAGLAVTLDPGGYQDGIVSLYHIRWARRNQMGRQRAIR